MLFKRAVQRYGRTPEPETPFQRAGQLWDERIGSARVQARNWRLMAFGCLGLTTAMSGGVLWQSLQSRVVPYVVEVDKLGEPRAVATAQNGYRPTDPQVAWFLSRFITDVRSVSLDPVLMRQDWLSAYAFATKRGAIFLGAYIITTDRRVYHLALTSGDRAAMVALSWIYPQDQLIAVKAAAEQARAAQPVAGGLKLSELHFGYAISGDRPAWRPLRAFDDGRQTFIEFPANLGVGDAPPLFLVDAKGTASLVNYRVQGRYYIVDRLFDAAELRLGLKRQDIVRISRVADGDARRRAS